MRRPPPRFHPVARAAMLAMALCAACGHEASREECETLFAHSTEIELAEQGVTDPVVVEKRVQEVKIAREKVIDDCVGKRVTDDAVACVKRAKTTGEVDTCLE